MRYIISYEFKAFSVNKFSFEVVNYKLSNKLTYDELLFELSPKITDSNSVKLSFNAEAELINYSFIPTEKCYLGIFLLPSIMPDYLHMPELISFHIHDYYEISYVISGMAVYIVDNKVIEVKAGEIIFFNRNVPHAWHLTQTTDMKVYCFSSNMLDFSKLDVHTGEFFCFFDEPYFHHYHLRSCNDDANRIKDDLDVIYNEYLNKNAGYEITIYTRLLEIVILLNRILIPHNFSHSALKEIKLLKTAIKYISENICEHISLSDVAKIANMKASYFSYYFKKYMGISFSDYVGKLRIAKSIELLKNTDMRVIDIAEECGFSSYSAYYQRFCKIYSISPQKFKTQCM